MKNDPEEVFKQLALIEHGARIEKTNNVKKKYKIIQVLRDAQEAVSYRIITPPIALSEDKIKFECPRCHAIFEAEEGNMDDFDLCYFCGQLWKKGPTLYRRLDDDTKSGNHDD